MSNAEFVMVPREVVESILQGAYTRFLTEAEVDGLKSSYAETNDLRSFIACQVDESCGEGLGDEMEILPSNKPIAWHAGGNGYDRIYLKHPGFLDGNPAINPIPDLMHLLALLPRYDLRNESNDASADPIAGHSVEVDKMVEKYEIAGYEGSSGLYYSRLAAVANGEQKIEPIYRVKK